MSSSETAKWMYASVRGSEGVVKQFARSAKIRSVRRSSMNAVESLTRAACCMLCVTITSVQDGFNSNSNSSIFAVFTGSSAEQGSSKSSTSGSQSQRPGDAQSLLLPAR